MLNKAKTKHYVLGGLTAILIGAVFLFFGNFGNSPLSASKTEPQPVKSGQVEINTFKDFALDLKDDQTKDTFKTSAKEALKLKIENEKYETKREFTQLVTPEFDFTAVAPHWSADTPENTNLRLSLRINNGKDWSGWQAIEEIDGGRENSNSTDYKYGELVFAEKQGKFFEYKIELESNNSETTPSLEKIKFHYLNAEKGPNPLETKKLFGVIPVASAGSGNYYSRSTWGANESYRYKSGKENWSRKYADTKAFVIHHTAGSSNPSNPAATIRAIYYYHAKTLDWGDIGYNYIVDQHGNMYEGRYGGDNVVAGHAANYNYGTSGISVLGNFETANPNNNSLDGVAKLISDKTKGKSFNPLGSVKLTKTTGYPHYSPTGSKTVKTVNGHRDVGSTACPGKNLYSKLATIRNNIQTNQVPAYDYKVISVEKPPSTMKVEDTASAKVKIKNTGRKVWKKSGTNPVKLSISNPKYRFSLFTNSTWLKDYYHRIQMSENQVNPGETATFSFSLTAPTKLAQHTEAFTPVVEGHGWMKYKGIKFDIKVKRPEYNYEIKSIQKPATQMTIGKAYPVTVQLKNVGVKTWKNYGATPLKLSISNPKYRKSKFIDSSWVKEYYYRVPMKNKSVKTGEVGDFKFSMTAPQNLGKHTEAFTPVIEGFDWMRYKGIKFNIEVKRPAYEYEVVSIKKPPSSMKSGEIANTTVKIKNIGSSTWKNYGKNPMKLAICNPKYRQSELWSNDWDQKSYRRIKMREREIKTGQTGTFSFSVTAPHKNHDYTEKFAPVVEGKQWLPDHNIKFTIKVRKPSYNYSVVSLNVPSKIFPKEKNTAIVKLRNQSSVTWSRSGDLREKHVIGLAASNPKYHTSPLGFRRTSMQETTVKPNEIATFKINIEGPNKTKTYTEYLQPVVTGREWLTNKGIKFTTKVDKKSYNYSTVSTQKPPAVMQPGQKTTVKITVKNQGNFTWHNNGPNPMKLAICNPKYRQSSFKDSSWTSGASSQRRISMDQQVVAPKQHASFTFTVTAPSKPKTYTDKFTLVQEGMTWLVYKGIYFKTKVPPQNGDTVKVGIAHSRSPQNPSGNFKITGTGTYYLKDSKGTKIKTCSGNSISEVGVRGNTYYLYHNNKLIKKTKNYPVFVPKGNTILSVPSYTRAGYNVNGDRHFYGNLQVRYNSYGDQYYPAAPWLINQLNIEDYLTGIAEQGDSSPREALKTFAVVSRTYAAYNKKHPKSICQKRGFHLFSSTYSQVFKGKSYGDRAPNLKSAINATRGIMITYNNEPIVAAYHSRCGGRTSSLAGYPYLKGVSCSPHRSIGPRKGHGWGMCMEGARNKASAGWNWKKIIRHYYTGISIKDFY